MGYKPEPHWINQPLVSVDPGPKISIFISRHLLLTEFCAELLFLPFFKTIILAYTRKTCLFTFILASAIKQN
jgi:hypothetical protein